MIYRDFGKTGLKVSAIGMGCEYVWTADEQKVKEVVGAAVEAGVNYFDLFVGTPSTREYFGKALAGVRDKVYLAGHLGCVDKDGQYVKTRDQALWHCSDIPYFFHNAEMIPVCHQPNYKALNWMMSGAFVNFARTGNPNTEGLPNWDKCEDGRMITMVFDDACYTQVNMQDELIPLMAEYKPHVPFDFGAPAEDEDEDGNAWIF